jgi:Zn-dependent protease
MYNETEINLAAGDDQEELSPEAAALINNIRHSGKRKSTLAGNLTLLIITAALFLGSGLIENPLIDILGIIAVILIHEAGHFTAMKIFGYRDVKMFFIPFFGAAVSGRHDDISSSKKAIISLAGPVPGIIIGYILLSIAISAFNPWLYKPASFFIYLNGFNLIPLLPLDGGRFMAELFYNRSRYLEAFFKIIASAAFIYIAFLYSTIFLGIIGAFLLITISSSYKLAIAAIEIKSRYNLLFEGSLLNQNNRTLNILTSSLIGKFPVAKGPGYYENLMTDLWDRLKYIPPQPLAASVLLAVYLICWALIIFMYR